MATGMKYPGTFRSSRGIEIEYDALRKKLDNIRLAVTAPPDFYPVLSFSGNHLFTLIQNTPLHLVMPSMAVWYCQRAIEPLVRGVEVMPYGEGSDVIIDERGGTVSIHLFINFIDLDASARVVFSPDVENPSASGFRLAETE